MSQKLKYHLGWNVAKTKIKPKLKCHIKWNNTKAELSLKLIPIKLKWH